VEIITTTYIIDLTRAGAANGVGNAHTVDANLVYCPVEGEEIDQV
jgi:hypothetical protein